MRSGFIAFLMLCFLTINAYAQNRDSLFVVPKDNGWVIMHSVKRGETLFMLSRRYHVPPAMLSDANGLSYQSNLNNNSVIKIPLGAFNLLKDKRVQMEDARPLYYRVQNEDNLYHISRYSGVQQRTVQEWNNLPDNIVQQGQVLFVGWVLYDATQVGTNGGQSQDVPQRPAVNSTNSQSPTNAKPATSFSMSASPGGNDKYSNVEIDTIKKGNATDTAHIVTEIEQLYMSQTNNELNTTTEKGPAVFFEMAGGASATVFYAFQILLPAVR